LLFIRHFQFPELEEKAKIISDMQNYGLYHPMEQGLHAWQLLRIVAVLDV